MGERRGPPSAGDPVPPEKVAVPELPTCLVARERLHSSLDVGAGHPVTLVCAPAGYGKTTLLTSWARGADPPVAWVRLGREDNQPSRLWVAALTALRGTGAVPDAALSSLARLDPGLRRTPHADRAGGEPAPRVPVTLVLDNVEELHGRAVLSSVEHLLRYQPAWLRLVLTSRSDPALPLYRMRLAGHLHEVRSDALRFTAKETSALLSCHGVALARRDLATLMDRTEGWPAGLRLAALSLESAPDPSRSVAEFRGDDQDVADYLAGEVLSRRTLAEREFMLATSVCDSVCAGLADALTGGDDAASTLHALHRANALTVRLGPCSPWYRYHPLLRDCLRAELLRRHPGDVQALHRMAIDWFDAHQLPEEAVRQALAAPDLPRAAALLVRHGPHLVTSGQGRVLRRLLHRLPAQVLETDPALLSLAALAGLDAGDVAGGSRCLDLSAQAEPRPRDAHLRVMRAVARSERARMTGRLSEALDSAERIPARDLDGADLSALALADRGVVHVELGQLARAESELRSALGIARERGLDRLTLQCMSWLTAAAGAGCHFTEAVRLGEAAARFAARHGWEDALLCAPAYEAVAWARLQRLECDAALRYCRLAGQAVRGQADPSLRFGADLLDAVTTYERGERLGGLRRLRQAWEERGDGQIMPSVVAFASQAEVEMALETGRPWWAAEALDRVRGHLDGNAETAVLGAAVSAARGHADAAREALRPALDGQAIPVVTSTLVKGWLLEARLCAARQEHAGAVHALHEALAQAQPERALRPFRTAGAELRKLLTHTLPNLGPLEPFATDVLSHLPDGHQAAPVEALTPREAAILQHLPSLKTTEEIAADLFISVNTLKTHLRSIYRKLQAGSRREAVAAARESGLL